MDIVKQLDGERIAKDVAIRSQALEVLNRQPKHASQWSYGFNIVFGSILGGYLAFYERSHGQLLLGAVSGAAFFLSITVFQECLRLRRRLDAAIVLLRINQH